MNVGDPQINAWNWLLSLPRIDAGWKKDKQQVLIQATPASENGIGEPLLTVSVAYPGLKERVRGTGNDLATAVHRVHGELWMRGIRLGFPNLGELARPSPP